MRSLVLSGLAAVLLLPPTLPCQGLVSWWPADGDAKDFVGGNHGTLMNGATLATGKVRQALSFDGIDESVFVNESPSLRGITREITIAAWIFKTAATPGSVVEKKTLGCRHFVLSTGEGTSGLELRFSYNTACSSGYHHYEAPSVLQLHRWHHVAARYVSGSPASMKLFVDGTEVNGSWIIGNGTGQLASLPSYLTIGSGETQTGTKARYFTGLIDEVEIYDRALSPFEVQALAGPRPPLRSDRPSVSMSQGGSQILLLDPGPQDAGKLYFLLGTLSGTTPGLNLGNNIILPLNPDSYFSISLLFPNSPLLSTTLGTLDATGKATARFNAIPQLPPPPASGLLFHHAYVVIGTSPFDFASNAVPLTLVK